MKRYQLLLAFLGCISLVNLGAATGAAVPTLLDDDLAQPANVAEHEVGGREQQRTLEDAPGRQLGKEKRPDGTRGLRTRFGIGYEFRMKRLERVERPQRPVRIQRPMRPSRPGR